MVVCFSVKGTTQLMSEIREPLSTVPYDLVFMHLILPYTIHYFRPRTAARQVGTILWKWLSRTLRVSSYMFGERHPAEEVAPKGFFGFRSKNTTEPDTQEPRKEGGWRRVPANDNVAIIRGMRATVEVTEDGKPVNEAEARLLKLQNTEADRHKRNVDEDYTVVYIPPHFVYRICTFILAVWSVCCVAVASMLAGPVLLGRRFFLLFTTREVHDGYSFVIGFHLLWGCWLVAQAVDRLNRHRQRRENGSRAWWPLFFAKRSSLWLAQASYMAFFLVFVIPTLIALVMEVYVLLPVKLIYDPKLIVKVKLVEMWVLGLFYTKIILRLPGFEAPRHMNEGIQRVSTVSPTLGSSLMVDLRADQPQRVEPSRPYDSDEGGDRSRGRGVVCDVSLPSGSAVVVENLRWCFSHKPDPLCVLIFA
jgi:E3 ubiquitin-protein ligase MARCH6